MEEGERRWFGASGSIKSPLIKSIRPSVPYLVTVRHGAGTKRLRGDGGKSVCSGF